MTGRSGALQNALQIAVWFCLFGFAIADDDDKHEKHDQLHFKADHLDVVDGFFSSLMMIIVSELGDKTFFIAAIMAMKHPRGIVLAGALAALALMTVLSAGVGVALPALLPRFYTHYTTVVLFIVFGVKLLKDAAGMDGAGPSEELEAVEMQLSQPAAKKHDAVSADLDAEKGGLGGAANLGADDSGAAAGGSSGALAGGGGGGGGGAAAAAATGVLWTAFTLTFLAEWGDRSQIATIALAAQKDPYGVTAGGILGHAACTGLAVVGGRMLASRISERTVSICGGVLFLLFAIHGIWLGPEA